MSRIREVVEGCPGSYSKFEVPPYTLGDIGRDGCGGLSRGPRVTERVPCETVRTDSRLRNDQEGTLVRRGLIRPDGKRL